MDDVLEVYRLHRRTIGLIALLIGVGLAQPSTIEGQTPEPPPSAAALTVRGYVCPPSEQSATIARLRTFFESVDGFRVSSDPNTAQLLVVAPPEVHAAIEDQLAAAKPSRAELTVPPRLWDEPNAKLRFRPATSSPPTATTVESEATTRFLLIRGDVARLQQRLATVLGGRLRRFAPDGQPTYVLESGTGPVAELVFDVRRGGVLVTARERVLQQLTLLFRAGGERRRRRSTNGRRID